MTFYIKLNGGLNNKLIPLISLLRIANKENKIIFVYWNNNDKCNNKLFTFNTFFKDLKNIKIIDKDIFNNELKNKNNIIYDNNSNYVNTNKTCVFINIVHVILYNTDSIKNNLKPYPKTKIINTSLISELRNVFTTLHINDNIYKKVQNTLNIFKNIYVIGIHLRTTDGGFIYHEHNTIFDFIEEKLKNNTYIYLACDSLQFENKIKNYFKNKILLFSSPFGNDYLDKFNRITFADLNGLCEMLILSKCNEFYGTPSSSFTFATWLLRNDNELNFYI